MCAVVRLVTSWLTFIQLSIRIVIEGKQSVLFLLTHLTAFSLKPYNHCIT